MSETNNSNEVVVSIKNLQKAFGDNVVLRDIDLDVHKGEVVVVLGPSGSGKSTMLRCINRLEEPTSGSIVVEGVDVCAKGVDLNKVRTHLGMVFQQFNLFPHLSVKKNVMLAQQKVLKRSKEEAEKIAIEELTKVGLAERIDFMPSQLSGGQQRRVAFAGVLAMEPEVLVLDEPMAGLDPAARRDFLGLIDRLHREGLTVVMVSHSMDDLANCCDRIVVMNEGAVFAEGTPSQVFAHANELKSIGLGVPAAQRMALALAQAGVPLRCDRLYTVELLADELAGLLPGCADGPLRVPSQTGSKIATREEGC